MQALVCSDGIGWKSQARRILVVASSSEFQAVEVGTSDGFCHAKDNEYVNVTNHASISQINQKVKENQVKIILAVTQNESESYEAFVNQVDGSISEVLSGDSSDIIQLVKNEYYVSFKA